MPYFGVPFRNGIGLGLGSVIGFKGSAGGAVAQTTWAVINGAGATQSVTFTVLDGAGTPYTTGVTVLNGSGTPYTPI